MESAAADFARCADSYRDRGGGRFMNPALNSAINASMAPVATPFFFYLLAGVAIISGVLVITRRDAVHSGLALIVSLLSVGGLYLILVSLFVSGVPIILYAGRNLGAFLVSVQLRYTATS